MNVFGCFDHRVLVELLVGSSRSLLFLGILWPVHASIVNVGWLLVDRPISGFFDVAIEGSRVRPILWERI